MGPFGANPAAAGDVGGQRRQPNDDKARSTYNKDVSERDGPTDTLADKATPWAGHKSSRMRLPPIVRELDVHPNAELIRPICLCVP